MMVMDLSILLTFILQQPLFYMTFYEGENMRKRFYLMEIC